jgi:hypothetical protein
MLENSISKSPQDNPQIITKQPLQVVAITITTNSKEKTGADIELQSSRAPSTNIYL